MMLPCSSFRVSGTIEDWSQGIIKLFVIATKDWRLLLRCSSDVLRCFLLASSLFSSFFRPPCRLLRRPEKLNVLALLLLQAGELLLLSAMVSLNTSSLTMAFFLFAIKLIINKILKEGNKRNFRYEDALIAIKSIKLSTQWEFDGTSLLSKILETKCKRKNYQKISLSTKMSRGKC